MCLGLFVVVFRVVLRVAVLPKSHAGPCEMGGGGAGSVVAAVVVQTMCSTRVSVHTRWRHAIN